MSWISDTFLGKRPDMTIPGWANEYIDDVQDAGHYNVGKAAKYARQDLTAAREGRIEDMTRLRPVMSAITANKAQSMGAADRVIRTNNAFEQNPASLTARMLNEVSGQLDQNAGHQFANAAAGAYSDAENELDKNRMFKAQMKMQGAMGAGNLAKAFEYDRNRQGGLLQGLMQQWLSPGAILPVAGMLSSGGSMPSIPKTVRGGGLTPSSGGGFLTPTSGPGQAGGSFKNGLYEVPFDGFPATLHEGERVLRADEADQYNQLEAEGVVGDRPNAQDLDLMNATRPRTVKPLAEPQAAQPPASVVMRQPDPLTLRDGFDLAMQRDAAGESARRIQPLNDPPMQARPPVVPLIEPRAGLNAAMMNDANKLLDERIASPPAAQPDDRLRDYDDVRATSQTTQPLTEPQIRQNLGYAADDYMPGPAQQHARELLREPPEQHRGKHVGLGERIMHGLKTAGKVLLTTRNPIDAAAGLVAGTVDPDSYHRFQRNAIDLPRALNEAGAEMKLQESNRDAAKEYGQLSGYDLYHSKLTPDAQHKRAQQFDWLDESNDRATRRLTDAQDKASRRLTDFEKLNLDRYKAWAATVPNGTPVPDELATGAHLPRGAKVYHHTTQGPLLKMQDGSTFRVGEDGVARPVNADGSSQPVKQYVPPPPRAPQTPQGQLEGLAITELLREKGINDANAELPNPAHEDHFQVLKAENEQAVKEFGADARLSDEALHARAAKKYPRKIRAGESLTPQAIKARAAAIAARGGKGAPSQRPVTTPTKRSDGARKVGDSVMYQGQRRRIAVIHENGDYELEPMQ